MSAPLVPSPLDYIGRQRFVFYPAIENAGPNEWLLGVRSWGEVQAVNVHSGQEIWIARRYIGAVSDNAVLTVGLREALAFHAGVLAPREKGVIEMPHAANEPKRDRPLKGPAAVVAIRLSDGRKSPASQLVAGIAVGGLLLALLAAWLGSAIHF